MPANKWFLVGIMLLTKPWLCIGQEGFSFSDYYTKNEHTGFVTNWSAAQDSNGFLYFATGDGVVIFDGVQWQHRHVGAYGRATHLFYSSQNEMYASGQYDFGMLKPNQLGEVEYVSLTDSITKNGEAFNVHFSALEEDSAILFYGNNGLNILRHGTFKNLEEPNLGYTELFRYKGNVYAVSSKGISRFEKDRLVQTPIGASLFPQTPTFTFPLNQQQMMIGFIDTVLYTFDGKTLSPFSPEGIDQLKLEIIHDAVPINDTSFALATAYGGVYFYTNTGKLLKVFNENSGLEVNGVYDLFIDAEGTLWLGTSRYIQKLVIDNPVIKFGEKVGVKTFALQIFLNGQQIWFTDEQSDVHSSYISEEKVLRFKKEDIRARLFQWGDSVLFYHQGGLYFSSGERVYEGEVTMLIMNYDAPENLMIYNNHGVTEISEKGIQHQKIRTNIEASTGIKFNNQLFLLSRFDGLFKLEADSLKPIPFVQPGRVKAIFNDLKMINGEIYLALEGEEGEGGNSGIYRYNPDKQWLEKSRFFESLDKKLVHNQVMAMEQCENGDIWVRNVYSIKRIVQNSEGWQVIKAPYSLIGEGDAIYTIRCNGDHILFGGINGIYQLVNPDWKYTGTFKTNITSVYVNNDSLIYGGFGDPTPPIVLPYKDNELRFTYAASSYINESQNTYSVKLEGFDKTWSSWSTETQKDYTNIPEGDYVFRVRSKNVYEVEGKEDYISFTVLPPWYRSWWAYTLYAFSISLILYTIYKIRINQLLSVERLRTKIASDLHDEVSATLTGISYFAEAIMRNPDIEKRNHFITLIRESAGNAKEKITDIVWAINPEHDSWEHFLARCRRFASDMLESKGMEYNLRIVEHISGKLTMNLRQHLWMIFKEIITNATRHSNATRVDVILDEIDGVLKLVIQDDGIGFNPNHATNGNGIANILKRAQEIHAHVQLNSERGMGTRWMITLRP